MLYKQLYQYLMHVVNLNNWVLKICFKLLNFLNLICIVCNYIICYIKWINIYIEGWRLKNSISLCLVQNIKKLLKIAYSRSNVSMMVHRVGNTLMLDEFDIHRYLLRQQDDDWKWLRKFFYETVLRNMKQRNRVPTWSCFSDFGLQCIVLMWAVYVLLAVRNVSWIPDSTWFVGLFRRNV